MIPIYTVMIVEDDETTRLELQVLFQNAGYAVKAADDFAKVDELVRAESPHLILMDVNLPMHSGIEICTRIRSFSKVPVIFVTSCNTTADEIRCITMGGDDFVAKPYNVAILLGRVANVLRRTYGHEQESSLMTWKDVAFDPENGMLTYGDRSVELTWSEAKILSCLFKKKGNYVSRVSLIEYLWENKLYIDDNTLSVNMARIRKKLSECGLEDFIETKRGVGYRI